jgi:hypothetical protein
MALWPEASELKQVLNVESEDWDDQLERLMDAAVARVKRDVGNWDEDTDVPTPSLAQAALRMAVLMVPNGPTGDEDPGMDAAYRRLLFGSRRKFGVA